MSGLRTSSLLPALFVGLAILASFCAGLLVGGKVSGVPFAAGSPDPPTAAPPPPEEENPLHRQTDVASLIRIGSDMDGRLRREALYGWLWGNEGFPAERQPAEVEQGVTHPRLRRLPNLARTDRLTVRMEFDMTSVVYHFHPRRSNGHLVLYHEGHGNRLTRRPIEFLLERGYAVLAFVMPQLGPNSQPIIDFPEWGLVRLETHDHLRLLESETFQPLRFFVEPVAVALNHTDKYFAYESVSMIGISGGAWTTALYAALDPRVRTSAPVAGSLPFFLRSVRTHDRGDYEQTHPDLYRIANRPELYVLACLEPGRQQVQVFNLHDSCCFGGERALLYEPHVQSRLREIEGGTFRVHIDDTHRSHKISEATLELFHEAIGADGP